MMKNIFWGGIRRCKNKYINHKTKIINKKYETKLRSQLKNDDFSIICSNCIGGMIYHRLGKQFLSPTVNLWLSQPDFLKFVKNLRYYLSLDLVFVESNYDYPVAQLDDIQVKFNHSKNSEEAETDWYRRRDRVNYDNLYIIMYDRDGITEDDIRSLETVKCKNKIVLSDIERPQFDYVYHIVPDKSHYMNEQFLDKDKFQMRTFEKQWDFVSFLNQKSL